MARFELSAPEKRRIEAIARELESCIVDFFADARESLSDEEWELLVGYARGCVRRTLEVGLVLHAGAESIEGCHTAYPGRGRDSFVQAALELWRDCYSPVPEIWRLAPVMHSVTGGEQRVRNDISVLEVMASNRMFRSLDDEYSSFFESPL